MGKTTASLLTRFTVTNFVVPGHTYNFQVRSRNKWGWSTLSAIKAIKASTWPNVVDRPITTIDPEDGSVVITWTKPDFNSSPIDKYIIEIQNMNNLNTWFQDVVYCNGANLIIIELAQCTIPMSQFTDPQLGYELFEPIVVRVTAKNAKGLSISPSLPSTASATTKTIPTVMHYNSITRGETTDEATLDIRWTPLVTASDTGDSEILSYNLQYD